MKISILIFGAWLLVVSAHSAGAADGVIDLSWGACSPVVSGVASVVEGGSISLYASIVGHDVPHGGYALFVLYSDVVTQTSPDAWRFDEAGCQGSSRVTIDHLPSADAAVACPAFQGELESFQETELRFFPPWRVYGQSLLGITLTNLYPAGNVLQVNPAQRYFLGRIRFDHANSVDGPASAGKKCGGLSTPMCFVVSDARYLTLTNHWVSFGTEGNRGVFTGPEPQYGCNESTPARPTTWGQIKSQYRD